MTSDESPTLKNIYEEIIRNRNDLKNSIEASEARVLLKLEAVNNKVSKLEKENKQLRDKLEILERQQKRNNIIVFGINKPIQEITAQYICQEINDHLETNLVQEDIHDIYGLGRTANRPIKVEIVSQLKKKLIIRNCGKLKGKNISIAHDLTVIQRKEAKLLRKHLIIARKNTEQKCYIKGNKLVINSTIYSAADLEKLEIEEDKIENKNNSAPSTPTTYSHNIYNPNSPDETFDLTLTQTQKQAQHPIVKGNRTNSITTLKNSSSGTPKTTSYKLTGLKNTQTIQKPYTRSTSSQQK